MGTISKNLNALVNDILYHYVDSTTSPEDNSGGGGLSFGRLAGYAIVLRQWTGKFVAQPAPQEDIIYAGGPAVVFTNLDSNQLPQTANVFWDKIEGVSNTAGDTYGDYDDITDGPYAGFTPSGNPKYINSTMTYGEFTHVDTLTTLDNSGSAWAEHKTTSTLDPFSSTGKWGLTFGLPLNSGVFIPEDISITTPHYGVPRIWEFWFKPNSSSPAGDVNVDDARLGQGPAFKWAESVTKTGNLWLGAYGNIDVISGANIPNETDEHTDTESIINEYGDVNNSVKFISVPDLSITDSNDDGYQVTDFDPNDKVDELVYRLEIDNPDGSNIGGSGWVNKPIADALAPSTGRHDYRKFLPNRIIYYRRQNGTGNAHDLASIKALRAAGRHDGSNGNLTIMLQDIVASGVFDLNQGSGAPALSFWYPLKSDGSPYGISEAATINNLPHFIPNVSGINLQSTALNIETSELPLTVVLERVTNSDGTLLTAQTMYNNFESATQVNVPNLYQADGEYHTNYAVSRLIYTLTDTDLQSNGQSWESGSKLNLHAQWGKKPVIFREATDNNLPYNKYKQKCSI